MGDGVNIAARLEGIADPGGICLSEDAYRQVRGKISEVLSDCGEQQLKNIAQPVRAYRIILDRKAARSEPIGQTAASAALALPEKPSIAVLPFQNMGSDPEQEYFADGIVEEIITGRSRIKWLFVIARNSSFAYKGKSPDIRQVGRELGVRYVLEGSVRKAGNRVRTTGQLIGRDFEAASGAIARALSLNPSCAAAFYWGAHIQAFSGDPALAEEYAHRALRSVPLIRPASTAILHWALFVPANDGTMTRPRSSPRQCRSILGSVVSAPSR
jgi:TolB-like protein